MEHFSSVVFVMTCKLQPISTVGRLDYKEPTSIYAYVSILSQLQL